MRVAIALYKYFPFGGLQNDMLRIAEECVRRGHEVRVLTASWKGEEPDGAEIVQLKVKGWTNVGLMRNFENAVADYLERFPADVSLAMNRISCCDWYFAGDDCLATDLPRRVNSFMLALNPRYCGLLGMEGQIFKPGHSTRIMHITPKQRDDYMKSYGTEAGRFSLLPPGMNPACVRRAGADAIRAEKRMELGVASHELALCIVGANLQLKGGDRLIKMYASLPGVLKKRIRLLLIGGYERGRLDVLAQGLGVKDRCLFTGVRRDIPELLLASDLMVHPARQEAAGSVLIEAIAAGVPVMCSGVCGFSNYVSESGGVVWREPFDAVSAGKALENALGNIAQMTEKVREYAAMTDFTARARVAVDLLEGKDNP